MRKAFLKLAVTGPYKEKPVITSTKIISLEEGTTLSLPLTSSIANSTFSITSGSDSSKFEISGSTLRFLSNGTKNYSSPDDSNGDNVYVVNIKAVSPSGQSGLADTFTVTITQSNSVPSFNSVLLKLGYYTLAGHGGVPLGHPGTGVLSSTPASSWILTRISGDPTAWRDTITSGLTPAPIRNLTASDNGTTAVYSITADGVPTGATLTLSIEQNGYTVSTNDQIDNSSTGLKQLNVKNQMGGRSVFFQRGSDDSWNNYTNSNLGTAPNICRIQSFNTHSNGTYIYWTSSDTAHKPIIGRMYIDDDNARHKIHDIKFEKYLTAWPANGLTASDHAADQTIAQLQCDRQPSVTDIEIYDCTFGAPSDITDPTQWTSGINMSGAADDRITDIHVHDVTISRVRSGLAFGNADGLIYENFTIYYFCGDAINGGATSFDNIIIRNFETWHPIYNPATSRTHPDHCQIGSTNSGANISNVIVEKFICGIGLGDRVAQGPFFNDTGFHSGATGHLLTYVGGGTFGRGDQKLTGYSTANCEIRNGLVLGSLSNGLSLDRGTGWLIRNCTLVKLSGNNVSNPELPGIRPVILEDSVTFDPITSEGVIIGNISMGSVQTANGISASGNYELTDPGDTYSAQIAYYDTLFKDPANGDWTPIANGVFTIDANDGIYSGCYNPDGSYADASGYLSTLGGTFELLETAAANTIAGSLTNVTYGSTLSLTNDAGGRVALSGNNIVRGSTALDFESSNSHSFTVRETLVSAINNPRDTTFSLNVINVAETPASYLVSTGGYFTNPSNVPSGTTRITFRGKVLIQSLSAIRTIFAQESTGCDLDILTNGLIRITVEDSTGVKVINNVTLNAPAFIVDNWYEFIFDVNHATQIARVTINGTDYDTSFSTAGTGSFQSNREVSFLAQSVGGQVCPSGTLAADLSVDYNGTTFKTISNSASTANADAWQKGTDFTQGP